MCVKITILHYHDVAAFADDPHLRHSREHQTYNNITRTGRVDIQVHAYCKNKADGSCHGHLKSCSDQQPKENLCVALETEHHADTIMPNLLTTHVRQVCHVRSPTSVQDTLQRFDTL